MKEVKQSPKSTIINKKRSRVGLIVSVLFAVFVVSFAGAYLLKQKDSRAASDGRQAVFLTNGQVYFGEIERIDENFLVIQKIYYLKTTDQLAGTDGAKIQLIKFGQEVHGPEDRMYINRNEVLFYENLRSDSKINEAINAYAQK